MGAVMTGFASNPASATSARGTPRALAVCIFALGEKPPESLVRFGPDAGVVPVPGQFSAGLRAPRNDPDPLGGAQRQHLALLLAVEQVDHVLHADETGPAVALGDAES